MAVFFDKVAVEGLCRATLDEINLDKTLPLTQHERIAFRRALEELLDECEQAHERGYAEAQERFP